MGHRWPPQLLPALPASCFKRARSKYLLNKVNGLSWAPAERPPRTSTEGMRGPPGVRHAGAWRERTLRAPRPGPTGEEKLESGFAISAPRGQVHTLPLAKESRSSQLPPRLRRECLSQRSPAATRLRRRHGHAPSGLGPAPPRARLRVSSAPARAESTLDALRSPTGPGCGGAEGRREDGGRGRILAPPPPIPEPAQMRRVGWGERRFGTRAGGTQAAGARPCSMPAPRLE